MSNKIYKTGIYARLSREDADRLESNSIQSQRAICLAYIEGHNDPNMYDGAMFSYQGDFLDYLGLEDMGVFTAHGGENGSSQNLAELHDFGASLK